ncbi:MAG: Mur ligase family protein [Bdellovibrionaceae bacterium]|nr:Mur ligase family protein [Pseudobdellovibrionaceae bacterium]
MTDFGALEAKAKADPEFKKSLMAQARLMRENSSVPLVAITGSNGKTGTKELARFTFGGRGLYTVDNHNTKTALAWLVAHDLARSQFAVLEVGASKPGDIGVAVSMLQPDIGVLLNVGRAHLGSFGSKEKLFTEKVRIFENPRTQSWIANGDDPRLRSFLKKKDKIVWIGSSNLNDVSVQWKDDRLYCRVYGQEKAVSPLTQSPGFEQHAAAVLAMGLELGFALDLLLEGIQGFPGTSRRFQLHRTAKGFIVDDAFNASPESVVAGLAQFRKLISPDQEQWTCIVLGSMLEFGEASSSEHRRLGTIVRELFPRAKFLSVGEQAKDFLADEWFAQASEVRIPEQSRYIYLKASKAIGLGALLGVLIG